MLKKIGIISILFILMITSFFYGWHHRFLISTDNAYVNADIVHVSARITDLITHIPIANNQYVSKGETLLEMDPVPFHLAILEAEAQLKKDQAQLDIANLTSQRTLTLVNKKVASMQEGDNMQASLRSALAAVEFAKSKLERAKIDLEYTKIISPVSGWIANFTLQEGDIVAANQPLFALISDKGFWIDANFKETELSKIRIGQKAKIKFDMYPNQVFEGIVQSISNGSGSSFSLLPPQNATGNWVKVTQRVPVRIDILNLDIDHPLRIGISANVSINID